MAVLTVAQSVVSMVDVTAERKAAKMAACVAAQSVVMMAAFSAAQWVASMVYVPAEWMAAMSGNKLWAFWLAGLLAAARDDDSMDTMSVVQKAPAKVIEMAVS